jgi:hypothetical protein
MAAPDPDELFLGERVDPATHERTGERVLLDPSDLTTHGVIVGMTGSGKTGLGIGLLEEALLQGIPVIALDPKGDLGNLLLTFPRLRPEDFAPWTEAGDGAAAAERWGAGLASWGIDGARIQALRDAAEMTIYTPGSRAGVPLNVLGALRRPTSAGADDEALLDEVSGFVSGVLGLAGLDADPLASREHILLSNLIAHAWSTGNDLDLAGLVGQVQRPPIRKLGVLELDTFFPSEDRTELALRLNGLLASPSFAAWSAGQDLDIEALTRPGGRTGCSIIALSHLSDEERQLVVAAVLGRLVTWMRAQPGTERLRVLVYFDEALGFAPPTAVPPAKRPLLTLFKQARAFGVGVVLATQNPVDLDYKALANAGTWMIGRLQTERDRDRLLDGMSAASGAVDVGAVGDTIAGLAKREFVLRRAGSDTLTTFTTRWTMSYLRGPLTRGQIADLMGGRAAEPASAAEAGGAPAAEARGDAVPVAPPVAGGVDVRWLDPAAPWAAGIGAAPTATTFAAGLAATATLLYDDDALDLRQTETWEAVLFPLAATVDPAAAHLVDHDPRDLGAEAPPGATYLLPEAPIDEASWFAAVRKALTSHLHRSRTTEVWRNADLDVVSRPGEGAEAFAERCRAVAAAAVDREQEAVRDRFADRIERAREALEVASDRVDEAEAARETRRSEELADTAGSLLDAVLGGRRSARRIARSLGGAASRRGRSAQADQRVASARRRLDAKGDAIADLEADLAAALTELEDRWDAKAGAIEQVDVPLEKGDIGITQLTLLWVPVTA